MPRIPGTFIVDEMESAVEGCCYTKGVRVYFINVGTVLMSKGRVPPKKGA